MADNNLNRERNELEAQALSTAQVMLGVQREILSTMQQRNVVEDIFLATQKKGVELSEEERAKIVDIHTEQKKQLDTSKQHIRYQNTKIKNEMTLKKISGQIQTAYKSMVEYLFSADKSIKEISLNFGIAGGRSNEIRAAIEDSAVQAARLNMKTEDLTKLYAGYVEQVGRTVALNGEQMEAMAALAKGTGLAVEGAGELAGKFEMMGQDAIAVNKTVQGILETSERMGVNATKVLKAVSGDFKRLQTYTFRAGIQGMGEMAAYGEKFKIDIGTALDSAESARTLEGAVDMAAKLQVLGGEFAKTDPFAIFHASRNDPKKFQQTIAEMTKGMASLTKVGDEFQIQIASPMARDMLKQAGDALGISLEKMTEMAKQQYKINAMRQEMFKSGYTKDQREIIEGMAQMDSSTGQFFVNINGARKDINNLTKTELQYLDRQKVSLEDRAKNAQTFDDQWKIFMMELKATGLPLLQGINEVLGTIRGWMDDLTKFFKDFGGESKDILKTIGKYAGWLMLFMPAVKLISKIGIKGIGALINRIRSGGTKTAADTMMGGAAGGRGPSFGSGAGAGLKSLGKGAGIGVGLAGAGAGIMLAAKGISELAKSLSMLNNEQLETLKGITSTLAWFMGAVAGIGVIASVAGAAALPLIAFGGAVTLIGAGIGAAAWGIGEMSKGMGELFAIANGDYVLKFSLGLSALALSSTALANPMAIAGITALSGGLYVMSLAGKNVQGLSDSLGATAAHIKGSIDEFREVREIINAIASADLSNLKALSNLNQLFSQPLKVEFGEKEVGLVANITMEIDGDRFVEKLGLEKKLAMMTKRVASGQ